MSLTFNQRITLDLTISRVQNIYCSQDDKDSRNVLIIITDNGQPYKIPSDISISLKISKPDNTYVYIDEDDSEHLGRNDDGTIFIVLSDQATCVGGICKAEFQLFDFSQQKIISTRMFNIIVEKNVVSDKDIESSIDSNIVKKMIGHLVDFDNPHNTDKAQVGLGNVPNVTTNNQTPTYTEAKNLENVSSGEKLSVAFGKISKAIHTLIDHIALKSTTKNSGHVQLTDGVNSSSTTTAATPNSVKITHDKLTEETDRAKQVENTLKTNLDNEIVRATDAETQITKNLNSEINRAKNKENEINTNLSNEVERATQKETLLENNLNAEINRAKSAENAHFSDFDNPHNTDKAQVGLGNVDNTSDENKPVSTAQQKAIDNAYENSNKYTDKKVADLINGAPETLDTLKEVADAITASKSTEEALNKAIGTKANQTELDTHTGNNTIHITSTERTNWNDSNSKKHTHSNKIALDGITSSLISTWNTVTNKLDKTGDASNVTNNITSATSRTNLSNGEKLSVSLGKIKKWFIDLKSIAFSGSYNDLVDAPTIGNGKITVVQDGITKGVFTTNQSDDITISLTDKNTTYKNATQSTSGLMSAADKEKLDGVANGANNYIYILPTASSNILGGVKTTSTVTSNSGYTACPIISGIPYYKDSSVTYLTGTSSVSGLTKLYNSTGTNTDGTMTQSAISTALSNKAPNDHTHSSSQVTMDDGNTVETNLGSIKGITSSLASDSSNYSLSASAGKNLQDQITTLSMNLSGLIKIASYTNSSPITISANSSVIINGTGNGIDMTPYIPNGYTAIGVTSFIMTSQNVLYSRLQIENNHLWYQVQNLNNSPVSLKEKAISFRILCIKTL